MKRRGILGSIIAIFALYLAIMLVLGFANHLLGAAHALQSWISGVRWP